MLNTTSPAVTTALKHRSVPETDCFFGKNFPMMNAPSVSEIDLLDRSSKKNRYGRSKSTWKLHLEPRYISVLAALVSRAYLTLPSKSRLSRMPCRMATGKAISKENKLFSSIGKFFSVFRRPS